MTRRDNERRGRVCRSRREGATAVEFALVAGPFFFLLFAIMELGLIFVTDAVMENAVMETGRLVRTGQAEFNDIDEAEFERRFCEKMSVFQSGCIDATTVDVREIPQFRAADAPNPLEGGEGMDDEDLTYVTGEPGSLMLVRVWYEKRLITPFMSQALKRVKSGKYYMTSTTSFRNEPYR